MTDRTHVVEIEKYLKYITPMYDFKRETMKPKDGLFDFEYTWDWGSGSKSPVQVNQDYPTTCDRCIYKEVKLSDIMDDIIFDDDDDENFNESDKMLFEKITTPIYKVGEEDADGIVREDNRITLSDFTAMKKKVLKNSIKCKCGSTFFVEDPEIANECPNCETVHEAKKFTFIDFLKMQQTGDDLTA